MDKMTYLQEAERHCPIVDSTIKIDSDLTLDFTQKITRALEVMHARGHIDDKTMEYLNPEDPKPGRFYLLPKIQQARQPGETYCISQWSPN